MSRERVAVEEQRTNRRFLREQLGLMRQDIASTLAKGEPLRVCLKPLVLSFFLATLDLGRKGPFYIQGVWSRSDNKQEVTADLAEIALKWISPHTPRETTTFEMSFLEVSTEGTEEFARIVVDKNQKSIQFKLRLSDNQKPEGKHPTVYSQAS